MTVGVTVETFHRIKFSVKNEASEFYLHYPKN